jgi:hypothetical protein
MNSVVRTAASGRRSGSASPTTFRPASCTRRSAWETRRPGPTTALSSRRASRAPRRRRDGHRRRGRRADPDGDLGVGAVGWVSPQSTHPSAVWSNVRTQQAHFLPAGSFAEKPLTDRPAIKRSRSGFMYFRNGSGQVPCARPVGNRARPAGNFRILAAILQAAGQAAVSVGIFSISDANSRSATSRSKARCMLIHNSGPLPQSLPMRSAIAGVIGCFSDRIS